jgi:hypothetical protein
MSGSSLIVAVNALLLKRLRLPQTWAEAEADADSTAGPGAKNLVQAPMAGGRTGV